MGPTGFLGLKVGLKQRLVVKHDTLRPLTSQDLLKMLIFSGLKEAVAESVATPRDLRDNQQSISSIHSSIFCRARFG